MYGSRYYAEYTIVGSSFVIATILLGLNCGWIDVSQLLAFPHEFAFAAVGVFLVVSYLVGVASHGMSSLVWTEIVSHRSGSAMMSGVRRLMLGKPLVELVSSSEKMDLLLLQRANGRLNDELRVVYGGVILLRGLVLSLPFAGLTIVLWLSRLGWTTKGLFLLTGAMACMWISFFCLHRMVHGRYRRLYDRMARQVAVAGDDAVHPE
jgi:hypothetical protein